VLPLIETWQKRCPIKSPETGAFYWMQFGKYKHGMGIATLLDCPTAV
jgi:hypothetical protein